MSPDRPAGAMALAASIALITAVYPRLAAQRRQAAAAWAALPSGAAAQAGDRCAALLQACRLEPWSRPLRHEFLTACARSGQEGGADASRRAGGFLMAALELRAGPASLWGYLLAAESEPEPARRRLIAHWLLARIQPPDGAPLSAESARLERRARRLTADGPGCREGASPPCPHAP